MYPRSGASNRANFGYAPELDGLRALAIFAVMGLHFAPAIVTAGSLGVDVFFVLSGYLITSILLSEIQRTGALDYKEFLARRAKRLLPGFRFALLLTYALLAPQLFAELAGAEVVRHSDHRFLRDQPARDLLARKHTSYHTWSLAIEEQFYIFWPFAVLWLNRFSPRRAVSWLFVSWIALTLSARLGRSPLRDRLLIISRRSTGPASSSGQWLLSIDRACEWGGGPSRRF